MPYLDYPFRNIPLSLFIGIGIVLAVYLLFNVALFCGPALTDYSNIPFILVSIQGDTLPCYVPFSLEFRRNYKSISINQGFVSHLP